MASIAHHLSVVRFTDWQFIPIYPGTDVLDYLHVVRYRGLSKRLGEEALNEIRNA